MKLAEIYSALMTRVVAGNFGLTLFVPNKDKSPTAGTKHARVWFLPSQSDAGSLGGTGVDAQTGIMQIDLMYPTNAGIGDILDKADAIAKHFQRGHSQIYGSACVQITGTSVTSPRNEDGWMRAVVSIGWLCHIARSVP